MNLSRDIIIVIKKKEKKILGNLNCVKTNKTFFSRMGWRKNPNSWRLRKKKGSDSHFFYNKDIASLGTLW